MHFQTTYFAMTYTFYGDLSDLVVDVSTWKLLNAFLVLIVLITIWVIVGCCRVIIVWWWIIRAMCEVPPCHWNCISWCVSSSSDRSSFRHPTQDINEVIHLFIMLHFLGTTYFTLNCAILAFEVNFWVHLSYPTMSRNVPWTFYHSCYHTFYMHVF